ncbi:hypothetical protein VRB95_09065 [Erwinia aphidicola]|uniref:hypothetical protein n=1 Tax=Erwinia aphidicola TaxID=68334 RepID=UPI0030CB9B73
MSGSTFTVTHHAVSSETGRTADGNGSHGSTSKAPSHTKSVSWEHYPKTGLVCQDYVYDVLKSWIQLIHEKKAERKAKMD